ncbi:MAG: Gfo/Idh/MocA family oxidoreductase [Clostridia bacterium]|nr:Gfo/Idh/MocA family oxidoreductase [Clostridia bacterium]
MSKKVIAVIGCGRIANMAHFPAFEKMEDVRVKYACDLIIEKAEKMKEKFPYIEQTITDYKVALEDKEVDVVYVLTPNYAHYTITMDALRAGKHVFCEKPITVNYELSCEMAKEAEKQGKLLNIGVCNRYNKSIEMLEEMNREGKFGNIYHVYCSFRSFRNIPGLGGAFTTKAQSGGGVLIDWGVHFFDLVLYILGGAKLKSVTCDAYCEMAKDMKSYKYKDMWAEDTSDIENGTNDVDDFITGHIRTDKASISFNGAWAQNINKPEMFIDFLGDKCGARLSYGGKFEIYDGETLETITPEYDIPNMYYCEDKAFLEAIEKGEKDRNNIENILESAKLLDTLYKSAELKEEVRF